MPCVRIKSMQIPLQADVRNNLVLSFTSADDSIAMNSVPGVITLESSILVSDESSPFDSCIPLRFSVPEAYRFGPVVSIGTVTPLTTAGVSSTAGSTERGEKTLFGNAGFKQARLPRTFDSRLFSLSPFATTADEDSSGGLGSLILRTEKAVVVGDSRSGEAELWRRASSSLDSSDL
nr:hypothetical protein Iba_chr02eCG9460 [Ipomoea batatas]